MVSSPSHRVWARLGLDWRLSYFKLSIRPMLSETFFNLFLSRFNVYRFSNFDIWSPISVSWLLCRSNVVRLLISNRPSGKVVSLQSDNLKNLSLCRHDIFSSIVAIWVSSMANYSKEMQSYISGNNYFLLKVDMTNLRSCFN